MAAERRAAEELAEILKLLELANDMSAYVRLYELLSENVMDGMRVSKSVREVCEEKKIAVTPERMELLCSYKGYAFMRKKWKKEQRRQKDMSLSWDEVIDRVSNFGKPIWECLCNDTLYVGDWMPELGRYLD